jgi:hypothetical protein
MPEQRKRNLDIAGRLGALWCQRMHEAPMWPIHGNYQCRICARSYPVPWSGELLVQPAVLAVPQSLIKRAA